MNINRFSTENLAPTEWHTDDQIKEIDMQLYFPSCYSHLAPVVNDISTLTNDVSKVGDGRLDAEGLKTLAGLFDKAANLTDGDTAKGLRLRSDAIRNGYSTKIIEELNLLNDALSFVGGNISSWYGKHVGGFATCFATCTNVELTQTCDSVLWCKDMLHDYIAGINSRLSMLEIPKYVACDLVFMSGEGASHPKHIAYFLPEDEGFKCSPIKKTHYFSNVHCAQINKISAELLSEFSKHDYYGIDIVTLGALGVLGHEYGHFITLPETNFRIVSQNDRWSSIMYQEIAADVFGFLILAEVWGPMKGFPLEQSCTYYLGELLRYANRGFGRFPDSDGMLFQLNYLLHFSALEISKDYTKIRITDPELVVAAMRSLARCIIESLLKNDIKLLRDFELNFGVKSGLTEQLSPFLAQLGKKGVPSLSYQTQGI